MPKRRYAIGTWNYHPREADDVLKAEATTLRGLFTYVVGQQETGRTSGNYHLQYVVYNRKGLHFKALCDKFKGSTYEAFDNNGSAMMDYVTKRDETRVEGTQFEAGIPPHDEGAVGKLTELCDDIKSGETDKEKLFDKYGATYARAYRAIDHCIQLKKPKPLPPVDPRAVLEPIIQVAWYYGSSGTGKTNRAKYWCFIQERTMYMKLSSTEKWWDDYAGESTIVLDDFRGNDMSFHQFLQLTDPYRALEYRVQTKCGHTYLKADTIIVTSPKHPIDCWKSCREDPNDWAQLKRRLTVIGYCTKWENHPAFDPSIGYLDVTSRLPPK